MHVQWCPFIGRPMEGASSMIVSPASMCNVAATVALPGPAKLCYRQVSLGLLKVT
jgi:hypothetical protein